MEPGDDTQARKETAAGNRRREDVTILIVDDEEMMRHLLTKILARDGYTVCTAVDGVDALEQISKGGIDIVLSDMKMPRMTGFELLKVLKSDYPDLGIIIMTAYGDTYTVKDVLLLGADEYITKPFKSYEVSLVLERAYWRLLSSQQPTSR